MAAKKMKPKPKAKAKAKPPLGSGDRFAALKGELAGKGAKNPGGLAAFIGRKKYGKTKFQKLAAKGRHPSSARHTALERFAQKG